MIKQSRWLDKNIPDLKGKNFLITGATSGLGFEAAKSFLYKGAKVYFAVRNRKKAEVCIDILKKEINKDIETEICIYDQSSLESIENFVSNLPDICFDAIILNAGIYFPKKGSISEDGTELTFYVNAIGTIKLFFGLKEKFKTSRFIFVNSIVNKTPKYHNYCNYLMNCNYKRGEAYGISKRSAMNLFGYSINHFNDLFVGLTHPGVTPTNIIGSGGFAPLFKKIGNQFLYVAVHKPWKACLGEVFLAASPKAKSNMYVTPRGLFHISGYPKSVHLPNKRIFTDSENLIETYSSIYLKTK